MLGIETSCDETSAAVVLRDAEGNGHILSNVVLSQTALHAPYGGVVPELAARAHLAHLDNLVSQAMAISGCRFSDLNGIAATAGPGLIGGLLTGVMTGKAIALGLQKPFFAINHLEAHALTPGLTDGLRPPYLMLLVSGGHTQFVVVRDVGDYERLGSTIDDALGEAFDKTAKLLGLGYPGGPRVEEAAHTGDATRFAFPVPMKGRAGCNFSFSGLKTAVRQCAVELQELSAQDISDVCAAFQHAACAAVRDRATNAMKVFSDSLEHDHERVLVASGGVAANRMLRTSLEDECARQDFRLMVPPAELCTDNAAMVAWTGTEKLVRQCDDALDVEVKARWPLDANAVPLPFAGVKA